MRARTIATLGSSPHTRGAPGRACRQWNLAGIIPAYAGSTTCRRGKDGRVTDHPRIRGEHRSYQWPTRDSVGSSPHTRGARSGVHRHRRPSRIIPAYAGSTLPSFRAAPRGGDHPRIRGEHYRQDRGPRVVAGSSPHTRGAPQEVPDDAEPRRIIPAYAGSTSAPKPMTRTGADHPRIRGEHPGECPGATPLLGSSPHTRGARARPP